MLINTIIVQVSILVNGNHFFHSYISESVGTWYILPLKAMSSGVTPYPDFKSANSRENFNKCKDSIHGRVTEAPCKPMTRAHGTFFVSELFKYFWNHYKSVTFCCV